MNRAEDLRSFSGKCGACSCRPLRNHGQLPFPNARHQAQHWPWKLAQLAKSMFKRLQKFLFVWERPRHQKTSLCLHFDFECEPPKPPSALIAITVMSHVPKYCRRKKGSSRFVSTWSDMIPCFVSIVEKNKFANVLFRAVVFLNTLTDEKGMCKAPKRWHYVMGTNFVEKKVETLFSNERCRVSPSARFRISDVLFARLFVCRQTSTCVPTIRFCFIDQCLFHGGRSTCTSLCG